ncbi:MAG: HlyD family efflux transporter periplasmic adaptor subunit [Delftia sp.]|uniref:efflux RND transporter periplasmic adaptor subunit n=1 Tax=Delftia TaxID=80865 RepID=UPI0007731080|nr:MULTISPECIES: HlyD family efflux transporter periplasmic adaptor subunit [Delftia]MPT05145.1 HlyD family efflux transporter periplasmic adaptor subunit [Delftia sp.]MPT54926.1 HlyD family efflux transporter periplasmic adaptor subunit [Delftia sp.]SFB66060.1 Multidrug efflux pump subunit AcrA (membrane-fusion protein) [Delftia tsuruhatensis]
MKYFLSALMVALCASVHAAPGAHGPNGEHLDGPSVPTTSNSLGRLPDGSVNVPMLAQRRLAIRTTFITEQDAGVTVQLPARIVMDPNAGGRVQTALGGRIEAGPRGLPVAGQAVRKGDVLAVVAHQPDPIALANQHAALAELRSSLELARQRVKRLEGLEGSVPRKDIEAARAELSGLEARSSAVGASLSTREKLVAPITGVISRADAVAGQFIEPRDVVYEIVDPGRVLVEASTADAALADKLSSASLSGIPDAELQLIGAARALRDGVLPLTFRLISKQALAVAVGQPVTVLAARKDTTKGYVLPAQAVTRNAANEPVVWIKSGAERYIPQPVQFRPLDAQRVVVTQGLGSDNRVVVQGAPLIAQIR